MSEHLLIGLAIIIVLGIFSQWLAWRLHLPAILLLLIAGFIAGPFTGVLEPDHIFGELLFPLVSISVALILFEGGLSLRIDELRKNKIAVRNLTTIGVIISWTLITLLAYFVVGLQFSTSLLIGAILVVTGPTVIIPMLRHIRPVGSVSAITKWEGIVNDPIGAILAVITFKIIISSGGESGVAVAFISVTKAVIFGGTTGLLAAGMIIVLLKRYLLPDFLQNPVTLMTVVMCYAVADSIQSESGLLAVTIMGIALANQHYVSIRHITEFKENLRVLLISSLFIILAARLTSADVALFSVVNWIFVALLILIVRPVTIYLSTIGTGLTNKEKLFLSWMAPRGIVAAAITAVFAFRLAETGNVDADRLVPLTFQVIVGTVALYGLTAPYLARFLKLSQPNPQGILFAGASYWVREVALVLQKENYNIVLVDSNWNNVRSARNAGLKAHYGNILSEQIAEEIDLNGIGRLLAVTPNDEVNSLSALHFADIFGRSEVYQLPPARKSNIKKSGVMPLHLQGRYLFSENATFPELERTVFSDIVVKKTSISEEFKLADFKTMYQDFCLLLFIIKSNGKLKVCVVDQEIEPQAGETLITIVKKSNQ